MQRAKHLRAVCVAKILADLRGCKDLVQRVRGEDLCGRVRLH